MAEYVTFLGTLDGAPVQYVTVLCTALDGRTIFQETFDTRTAGVTPTTVLLEPGEYYVTGRADGLTFPFLHPVTVYEGEGESASSPLVVELPATSSVRPGTALPCKVWGYIDTASPNTAAGSPTPSVGTTFDAGPSMGGVHVQLSVWFRLMSLADGEVRNLSGRARTMVAIDRHGYFEAALQPNSLYSVSLPGVSGVRYLRTPGPAESADLETLIDSTLTSSLSELV